MNLPLKQINKQEFTEIDEKISKNFQIFLSRSKEKQFIMYNKAKKFKRKKLGVATPENTNKRKKMLFQFYIK